MKVGGLSADSYDDLRAAVELLDRNRVRMPKGAIVAVVKVNHELCPGALLSGSACGKRGIGVGVAPMDAVGLPNLRLKRVPCRPSASYAVIE